ncbi:MAG: tripartite tricarboxylate transporter substrate binding protein [Burkholderiales bacterium]
MMKVRFRRAARAFAIAARKLPAKCLLMPAVLAIATGTAIAQSYPSKPIRLISEYAAGAGGDVFFRPLAAQLAAATEQKWIIENRAGAGGLLAIEAVMRAPADGYTLLIASQNVPVTRRYLSKSKPVDPHVDLTPIAALWRTTLVLASHPSFPPKSLKEMIAYARAHPGKVSYSTSGIGTQAHFAGAHLARITGASLLHVPYNNNRQVIDVLAGDVPVAINIISPVAPHVRTGRLRVLAVLGYKRLEILPGVPTASEWLPQFEPPPTWTGLFAPAGLPRNIVARLNAAVAKTVAVPELRARATADGFELIGNTPEEFVAQLKRDIEVTGRLVKAANIEPTD